MSKDLLVRDSWSADHFGEEIKTTMTELAAILTLCKDTVFTVCFNKKVTEAEVQAALYGGVIGDKLSQIQKAVTVGEDCKITGYLAGLENDLGRSLVIDLNSKGHKYVDHRSIKWIIHKNIKYSLGKKSDDRELPIIPTGDRWDSAKLQLNNWFSSTVYYKVMEILDNENLLVKAKGYSDTPLKMARNILETEMNSGSVFDKTEKLTRTALIEKLMEAGETVFTVSYNKKVDNKHIQKCIEEAGE
jgi:hypothetical protein